MIIMRNRDTVIRNMMKRTLTNGSTTKSSIYDVFIVGGGVVGSSLAKLLSETTIPLSIGIMDSRRPPPLSSYESSSNNKDAPFARSYALSPSSLATLGLEEGGVINRIRKLGRVKDYDKMQVWECNGPGNLKFTSSDLMNHPDKRIVSQNVLGSMLEDSLLVSSLWDFLQETIDKNQTSHKIHLIAPAKISKIISPKTDISSIRTSSNNLLQLSYYLEGEGSEEHTIRTKLLVAADGADSHVRKSLSMPVMEMGYGRTAVISTVVLACSPTKNHTAFQRFFPSGPVALLPMWNNFANVVWSTTPDHARQLTSMTPEQFVKELNEALQVGPTNSPELFPEDFSSKFPSVFKSMTNGVDMLARAVGEGLAVSNWMQDPFQMPPVVSRACGARRFAFDLTLSQSRNYVSHRVALVGDAAHRIHPMAGQGLNLGIADAACLAKVINEATTCGMDPGDAYFLKQYEKERQQAVLSMMAGIQLLHVAFSTEFTPALWLRSIGVNLVNSATPIRQKLANFAAGNIGG